MWPQYEMESLLKTESVNVSFNNQFEKNKTQHQNGIQIIDDKGKE